jgi:hypothetical protein
MSRGFQAIKYDISYDSYLIFLLDHDEENKYRKAINQPPTRRKRDRSMSELVIVEWKL